MAWRTARSILALHAQLKAASRAAPPATDAGAWGTIGDTAHTSTSDHAPKDFPGWGNDIVTAGDFPNAPALGLDARRVLDDIRRSRDSRVKYGISNGQMFSSYAASGYPAWTWRPYSGNDGHYTHGHLSVVGDARADGEQPWQTIGGDMAALDTNDPSYRNLIYTVSALAQGTDVKATTVAGGPTVNITNQLARQLARLEAAAAADEVRDQAALAAVQALASAGGVDAAPILAAIAAARAETHDLVVQLQQQVADVQARNVRLAQALAAVGGALDSVDEPVS